MFSSPLLLALIGTASGTVLWDGRLNGYTSSAFLNDWSFSNEVGPYQYYIHGTGNVTEYVNLGTAYKNPADTASTQGIQITIDNSSVWNNGMLRTELIPQTTAAINEGKVWYHFSVQHTATNPPSPYEEHQVCFFESHFTEMKYGLIDGEAGTSDPTLRWDVNSVSQWNVTFEPDVWHNIAYEIDFTGGSVAFYHSTGSDDLVLTVPAVKVSASSNGADWHLGVLRLPSTSGTTDTAAEDWHFSGVYIESGSLTTSVTGPADDAAAGSSSVSSAGVVSSSSTSVAAASSTVAAISTSTTAVEVASSSTTSSTSAVATTFSTAVKASSIASSPISSSTASSPTSTQASSSLSSSSPTSASTATIIAAPSSSATTISAITTTSSTATATSIPAPSDNSATSTAELSSTTKVASVSSASNTSDAAITTSASTSPTGAKPHHSKHHRPSSSETASAAANASTTMPEGVCDVQYVYV